MVIITAAGGSTLASVLTTVVTPTATVPAGSTADPSLSNSGSNSSTSGLSTSARNTIIGVVVGVGGAALLLGIGYVCWRLWGNKKHNADENDDLMGLPTSSNDMSANGTGQSPFKSTLDQYHNPAGQVNTSSNF